MENYQPPRRRPTPKLTIPGLGSTFAENSDMDRRHLMWLFLAVVIFLVAYTIYDLKKISQKVKKGESTITGMEWKGKVSKKYMGYNRPDSHLFEYADANGKKTVVDISADQSAFFDILMPRDSIYKSKENRQVRIKNYVRDTTLSLKFK